MWSSAIAQPLARTSVHTGESKPNWIEIKGVVGSLARLIVPRARGKNSWTFSSVVFPSPISSLEDIVNRRPSATDPRVPSIL